MAETVEAQCGYCQKRFRLRPDQLSREVRCPHCKTIVKIPERTETAAEAVRAIQGEAASPGRRASGGRGSSRGSGRRPSPRPGAARQRSPRSAADLRRAPVVRGGVRSRNVAIVWAVLIGLALVGTGVGLVMVFGGGSGATEEGAEEPPAARGGAAPSPVTPGGVAPPGTETGAGHVPGAAPPEPVAPATPQISDLVVDIKRLLFGYRDETVTYAVGRVTNKSGEMIRALKVTVGLWESEDGEKVGDAAAVILNLPPGYTAPVVAACEHAQGVRPRYRMPALVEMHPPGAPLNLPPLETSHAIPIGNPNAVELSGLIETHVTNHGEVPVKDMVITALLLDEKGKVVGAANRRASEPIGPGETKKVTIDWRHCSTTQVKAVETWAQPHVYPEK